jgi:metallo-beta-lactamase family protein
MPNPQPAGDSDYIVMESTYGNRSHPEFDIEKELTRILLDSARKGGHVIVPAFAVGRTQSLLYYLEKLKRTSQIPNIPVFLDSPMAINASKLYCKHSQFHKLTDEECARACGIAKYTRETDESKQLAHLRMPSVIISASGMATGGRILHHLKHFADDFRNTILFTGFQAAGTRGRALVDGKKSLRIHGLDIPVRAKVHNLDALSAHADSKGLLGWLSKVPRSPKATFVTHGEPEASESLARSIRRTYGWQCLVPQHGQTVELN